MKPTKQRAIATPQIDPSLTLGEFAHRVIGEQYQAVVKQEKKVIADKNPEHLHDMRVGTRRLRTALQVFDRAIAIPKAATAKRVGSLSRVLGTLRDLDVQTADLKERYRPNLAETEQRSLDEVIAGLNKERRVAFADVEDALTRSRYQHLKIDYEAWLSHPRYTLLATQRLLPLIPDLLSPLLSTLLLHPGWLVQADASDAASEDLHDLRKACKHVRYQAEFFVPFYSEAFQDWIKEIKTIQSKLGTLHDSQVLQTLLAKYLPKHSKLCDLEAAVKQTQTEALAHWDSVRERYLEPAFRQHLHYLLLEPFGAETPAAKRRYA
ncbi:CHAD domain-containing protein [Stenomitos frigidus]|uniref:Metal-binding protein n=1 Tax=Stenomitos frigidus ULC18 TaxID=2107698 RepID=A0A2T1DWT6_9CYAN|nr:CHAD domain-containing protein [Stenomitos frigidus]PSB24929.1 metal-binding protein [Stenomitos frigidus ULC18]